ncbi:MAG: hypothetical protein GXO78_03950 [Calditrichaeota bacterium]|nr:hypothetical protein [Calditrichota bacterium]
MIREESLLQTKIEMLRVKRDDKEWYYKLIIGTDPETSIIITDPDFHALLSDLPSILSTVIQSQVLIETPKKRRNRHHEGTRI